MPRRRPHLAARPELAQHAEAHQHTEPVLGRNDAVERERAQLVGGQDPVLTDHADQVGIPVGQVPGGGQHRPVVRHYPRARAQMNCDAIGHQSRFRAAGPIRPQPAASPPRGLQVRRQVERAGAVAGQPAGPPGGTTSPGHPHIAACGATALSSPNTTREAVPDRVRGIARAVIHDRSRIVAVVPWAARAQARTNTACTRWRIHRGEQPLPDRNRGHTAPARVPAPVAAGRRTPYYRNRVTRPVSRALSKTAGLGDAGGQVQEVIEDARPVPRVVHPVSAVGRLSVRTRPLPVQMPGKDQGHDRRSGQVACPATRWPWSLAGHSRRTRWTETGSETRSRNPCSRCGQSSKMSVQPLTCRFGCRSCG
jgi:hypothetical protein